MARRFLLLIVFVGLIIGDSILAAWASDCAEVGKKISVQKRGILVHSMPVVQDGKDMCTVVVVIPSHDVGRPRRVEIVVPAH